jgi:hypothetical protein
MNKMMKAKMMATGGMSKKGYAAGGMTKKGYAAGGMAMVEKDGMKVPAFAADGKGKMAKGGDVKKKMEDKAMPKGKSTGVVGKPSGVAILITPAKKMNMGGAVKPMAKKK